MTIKNLAATAAPVLLLAFQPAHSHENDPAAPHAADHAPIGVMADHRHEKGEWMLSYRFMRMEMQGNRIGNDPVSADEIVTTIPNRFASAPMQPPTLRVVPLEMTMDMHMVGAMVGLHDRVTLMAMGSFLTRQMDHVTYQGGMGTGVLGEFSTSTEGFGDTQVALITGLDDGRSRNQELNVDLGLSLPTGSITEIDTILTPMGMRP
jgi:hypothetical protein